MVRIAYLFDLARDWKFQSGFGEISFVQAVCSLGICLHLNDDEFMGAGSKEGCATCRDCRCAGAEFASAEMVDQPGRNRGFWCGNHRFFGDTATAAGGTGCAV